MNGVNSIFSGPIFMESGYFNAFLMDLYVREKTLEPKETSYYENKYARSIDFKLSELREGESRAVILPIKGPILKYTSWSFLGTKFLGDLSKKLDKDERVSAIIYDLDSGGGTSAGTSEFADTIKNISKPTIAYTDGILCSAAYKIIASCDKVVANPFASLIGSIGSYIPILDMVPLLEKLGAKYYEEYAPQSSKKNKWFRDLREGSNEEVQAYLEKSTQEFIDEVKQYRPQIKDDGSVFKGETYNANDALSIGLVDEVMKLEEFINQF